VQGLEELADCFDGLRHFLLPDVIVGDKPVEAGVLVKSLNPESMLGHMVEEAFMVKVLQTDRPVDQVGLRLLHARHQPWNLTQPCSQGLRHFVVFLDLRHEVVEGVLNAVGEDGVVHESSSQGFPDAFQAFDVFLRAEDGSADRAAESLRKAEAHGVIAIANVLGLQSAVGVKGVVDAGAINVDRHIVLLSQLLQLSQGRELPHLASVSPILNKNEVSVGVSDMLSLFSNPLPG
jgi:hypothetical protein